MPKDIVVIGLLGTALDSGSGPDRWEKWRPTLSICRFEDLLVSRFELLVQKKFEASAQLLIEDIQMVSPETTTRTWNIDFADPWDFEQVYAALHAFARNYEFNTEKEEYLVHITTGTHVAQICMFLLTESRHLPGKLLQTSPPTRDKSAPGKYIIIDLDLSKYDEIASRFSQEQREAVSFLKSGIETRNAEFNRLIERIEQVASLSESPILLMGPTGAGKSQLAKRIYELKKSRHRIAGKFVEVNCATLRGDSAMSALFGHTKGAFTGANSSRDGLLRAANGGVLFLDEIGELGLDEQAMLLRALEEKTFLPLGSDQEVSSNFQLIGGTNRALQQDVVAGKFREDLLARINLWTFRLPGLRHRLEDIEPNLEYELEQYTRRTGNRVTISKEAKHHFLQFATAPEAKWLGNFRDLNGAVTRMVTLASGGRISLDLVAEEIVRLQDSWQTIKPVSVEQRVLTALLGNESLAEIDRFDQVQLLDVIAVCLEAKTISEAGRILFASSRQEKKNTNDADRLRKYLARFEIQWQDIKNIKI